MIIKVLNDEDCHDLIESLGIEFVVYYYTSEMYEGYGNALLYKEGKWFTHDMGHCSCFDAFDEFELDNPFDILKEAIDDLHEADYSKSFNEEILQMHREANNFIRILNIIRNGI